MNSDAVIVLGVVLKLRGDRTPVRWAKIREALPRTITDDRYRETLVQRGLIRFVSPDRSNPSVKVTAKGATLARCGAALLAHSQPASRGPR
jgi:hypothetical protein